MTISKGKIIIQTGSDCKDCKEKLHKMENPIIRNENLNILRKILCRNKSIDECETIASATTGELLESILQNDAEKLPDSPAGAKCKFIKSLDATILEYSNYYVIFYNRISGQDGKLPHCFENKIKISLKGN